MNTQLLSELLAKGGANFASFEYTNSHGERSRYTVLLNANLTRIYKRDIAVLKKMLPQSEGLRRQAIEEILASKSHSIEVGIGNNEDYRMKDKLVNIGPIRVHKETNEIFVNGMLLSKRVIEPGVYPKVNSRPLTLEKRQVEKSLRSPKCRTFKLSLESLHTARINKKVLELA
jgi:hypothetical protein